MTVERGVDGSEEKPTRPQVFQSELKNKVSQQHQDPNYHELQERVCTEKKTNHNHWERMEESTAAQYG